MVRHPTATAPLKRIPASLEQATSLMIWEFGVQIAVGLVRED